MNELKIINGELFLNNIILECVKDFKLKSSTEGIAELVIKMDVVINQSSPE